MRTTRTSFLSTHRSLRVTTVAASAAMLLFLGACSSEPTVVSGSAPAGGAGTSSAPTPDPSDPGAAPASSPASQAPAPPATSTSAPAANAPAPTVPAPAGGPATSAGQPAPSAPACTAANFPGKLNTTGAPPAAAATASKIFAAVTGCQQANLAALANASGTILGERTAEVAFGLPDSGQYKQLAELLASEPGSSDDETIWPKAAADPTGSYSGYQVSINNQGAWTAFYR